MSESTRLEGPLLKGKVAYVTGSSRGIGLSTARLFASQGATVLINGHSNRELLETRAQEIRETCGVEVEAFFCDVSDPVAVATAFQEIFKRHRRLDVLVNNAGILEDALLGMIPPETVDRTLAVNVAGIIYNLQAAARLMGRQGAGSIINTTSIIATHGNVGQTVYGASKAAILGVTRSAAKELAPRNIRVNAVAPGFIDTDMARQIPEEKFAERLAGIPLGRIGSPDDVARVNLFLASDLSSYVTGQVIGVDGGMVI